MSSQPEQIGQRERQQSDGVASVPTDDRGKPPRPDAPATKTVNIRGVPIWVWKRARQNALTSNLSFTEYVTRLLADSEPYQTN